MEKIEDHTRMNNQHFLYLFLSAENRKISKASGLEYRDRNANLDQKFIYQAEIAGFEDSTGHYGQTTVLGKNIPEKYHAPE
jgi:hypothetical protein